MSGGGAGAGARAASSSDSVSSNSAVSAPRASHSLILATDTLFSRCLRHLYCPTEDARNSHMFVQFFREPACKVRVVAWLGLAVVLAYSAFAAYIKSLLNEFYYDFYDLMQISGTLLVQSQADAGSGGDGGVDESTSGDQLTELSALEAASTSNSYPLATLSRRSSLRRQWPSGFDPSGALPGASRSCAPTCPPGTFTQTSSKAPHAPPRGHPTVLQRAARLPGHRARRFLHARSLCSNPGRPGQQGAAALELGALRSGWLLVAAYLAASVSLFGAFIVGKHLVQLEVENQRTEAGPRRDLVILEASPASLLGDGASVAAYNRRRRPPNKVAGCTNRCSSST